MKKEDVAILGVIALFSIVVSLFVPKMLFGSNHNLQVEKVPVITDSFEAPSHRYFNNQSLDVTPYIQIGNNNNITPFNSQSN